uniref:Peptidase A1 domain-containing protein n=1 Tax=Moniliophthora roreri TaxID=221103 RepID=A0A0W0F8B4_MONRR
MLSLAVSLCILLGAGVNVHAAPLQRPSSSDLLARTNGNVTGSFDLPIRRTNLRRALKKRGDVSGTTGLGNNADLLYTVPIHFGDKVTAVHLDTGSSDLWSITDACTTGTCSRLSSLTHPIESTGLNTSDARVIMRYGDSLTGTNATGAVAFDTATVAGVAITNQAFAAVDSTTNSVVQFGAAGIFGLSFPSGSDVQEALVVRESGPLTTTDAFVKSTWKYGPLLSRISMTNQLEKPMFSIELQRSTIDAGTGGDGMLTVGKLPDDVDENSLTWVPVRLYKPEEGGLRPPTFAPNEVYPFRWEIDIDGVFLDGERVPDSAIPATGGVDSKRVSALIDTGNSLLRGPRDVVNNILSQVSPNFNPNRQNSATFPCDVPHTLSFQIGGKMFPIDPRDFIGEVTVGDASTCVADNLVETDAPGIGALFRWSLGDPFFKSNLVAFHYGNLTHPSVDPPRVGLLSIVPPDADAQLKKAVQDAQANGGVFESTLEIAPTASAATAVQITVSEVPPTSSTAAANNNGNDNAGAAATTTTGAPGSVVTISMDGPDGGSRQDSGSISRAHVPVALLGLGMVIGVVGVW